MAITRKMNTIKAEGIMGEQKDLRHSKMTPQILKDKGSTSISIDQIAGRSEDTETNPVSETRSTPETLNYGNLCKTCTGAIQGRVNLFTL